MTPFYLYLYSRSRRVFVLVDFATLRSIRSRVRLRTRLRVSDLLWIILLRGVVTR